MKRTTATLPSGSPITAAVGKLLPLLVSNGPAVSALNQNKTLALVNVADDTLKDHQENNPGTHPPHSSKQISTNTQQIGNNPLRQ